MADPFTPLAGIRLLDLSRYLPGPFLTRVLTDLGADVIKVEAPTGDAGRFIPPVAHGTGTAFAALNWGKRSMVIDLKHAVGRELMLALVDRADVLVESFRPGVLERLGLSPESLLERNKALIVCSVTGFGQTGPLKAAPGHDIGYMARSGALSLFAPADGPPQLPGVQIADIAGALHGAIAILGALHERHNTGRGRHLDISLCHSAASFVMFEHARRLGGQPEAPGAGMLTGGRPGYRIYETADGKYLAFGAIEPQFFNAFCERAGCAHLAGKGMAVGVDGAETIAELQNIFASHSLAQWLELLAGCECCCEPITSPEAAVSDMGFATANINGLEFLMPHLGAQGPQAVGTVPQLGEHGAEVALELELDTELVDRASRAGVFWTRAL